MFRVNLGRLYSIVSGTRIYNNNSIVYRNSTAFLSLTPTQYAPSHATSSSAVLPHHVHSPTTPHRNLSASHPTLARQRLQRAEATVATPTIEQQDLLDGLHADIESAESLEQSFAVDSKDDPIGELSPEAALLDAHPELIYTTVFKSSRRVLGYDEGEEDVDNEVDNVDPKLVAEELNLETKALQDAVKRYQELLKTTVEDLKRGTALRPAQKVVQRWFRDLRYEALAGINKVTTLLSKDDTYMEWLGGIREMSVDKLAIITLHSVMSLILAQPEGVPYTTVVVAVGRALQAECNLNAMRSFAKEDVKRWLKYKGKNPAVWRINMKAKHLIGREKANWDPKFTVQVGAALTQALLESAKITITPPGVIEQTPETILEVPALLHDWRVKVRKSGARVKKGVLKAHPEVYNQIEEIHELRQAAHARMLPMVVKPLPWTAPNQGGYLQLPHLIMRINGYLEQGRALWHSDMSNVYEALNVLGNTAWRINEPVFRVMTEAWEQGGGIAELPSRFNLPLPMIPIDYETNEEAKRAFIRADRSTRRKNTNLHSLRSDFKLKLNVAKEFVGRRFYFPHSMDFRGRAYPIPPHLNHMGSDLCRGLLTFDDTKPLGRDGLRWLKIHVSNLFGVDKVPFDDRILFIDQHIGEIMDSADNPLTGNRWWVRADSQWQCLAACIELTAALRSPHPEKYLSRLPIHQDGTCNGLQHYAALGGDEMGARQVNLLPSDRPQDVYSGVAKLVAEQVAKDARTGDEIAIILEGKIDRKVVKQVVMTSVYGVTFVGARAQIQSVLKDRKIFDDERQLYKSRTYLARCTFNALGDMFSGARAIMDWLGTCARDIGKKGDPVVWISPLGLPIVQPYRKPGHMHISTVVQSVTLATMNEDMPILVRHQRSAFPPNYVHSLDSSHMYLTALAVRKEDLTFAAVHDSYWSHACDRDKLAVILRKKFIELHSMPLLEQLQEFFRARYPKTPLPPVPKKGDFDLREIMRSKYFFH